MRVQSSWWCRDLSQYSLPEQVLSLEHQLSRDWENKQLDRVVAAAICLDSIYAVMQHFSTSSLGMSHQLRNGTTCVIPCRLLIAKGGTLLYFLRSFRISFIFAALPSTIKRSCSFGEDLTSLRRRTPSPALISQSHSIAGELEPWRKNFTLSPSLISCRLP
jgi:hypothetical protein